MLLGVDDYPGETAPARLDGNRTGLTTEEKMKKIVATIAPAIFTLSAHALAADNEHALGEHPAVIVKRSYDKQGYDYASKFYPHPAGFYLYSRAPKESINQGPTVVPIAVRGTQIPESTAQATSVIARDR